MNDTLDISRPLQLSADLLVVGAHPVVAHGLVGVDDNVVPLANVNGEDVGLVRHNGYKVVGDDPELVSVDVELEGRLDGGVEYAQTVGLAGHKVHLEALASLVDGAVLSPDVHAVDQTRVEDTGTEIRPWADHGSALEHLVNGTLAPVL